MNKDFDLDIAITCPDWNTHADVDGLEQAMAAGLKQAEAAGTILPPGALYLISIVLGTDDEIAELNEQWRGKKGPTNVLSFALDDEEDGLDDAALEGMPRALGDIYLAYGVVAREAEAEGKTLRDHMLHLSIHGLLHLLGHEHETEEEAEHMRRMEIAAMRDIGCENPYNHIMEGEA